MRNPEESIRFAEMGVELGEIVPPEIVASTNPPGSGGQPKPPPEPTQPTGPGVGGKQVKKPK